MMFLKIAIHMININNMDILVPSSDQLTPFYKAHIHNKSNWCNQSECGQRSQCQWLYIKVIDIR